MTSLFPKIPDGFDEFHAFEVTDRLHVITNTIEHHISNHPLVEAIPTIKEKVDAAIALLYKAYQEAGSLGFTPPSRKAPPLPRKEDPHD